MPSLSCDGVLVSDLQIADTAASRRKGLLGRKSFDGALMIRPCSSIHTLFMKFAIDVAYCDAAMRVIDVHSVKPFRLARPRRKSKCVVEATAGSFERWNLHVGSELQIIE
jgi:uncharacterized protein